MVTPAMMGTRASPSPSLGGGEEFCAAAVVEVVALVPMLLLAAVAMPVVVCNPVELVPVAVDIYDNLYKLPSFAKRAVGPKEAEDELVAYCREYSEALRYLAIEKNGFQEYLVYNLKKRFQKENLNVRIIPIENRSAKTGPKRIGMLVPINEEGRFWIKETDQLIKEEMHGYPNAKHEHLLDGTQIGIRFRRKPVYHTTGQEQIQKRRQKREKQEYNWMTSTVRTRKSA